MFYDYFNKTLWATVDELGRERVEVRVSPTVPVRRVLDRDVPCIETLAVEP